MGGDHKCPLCDATFTRPQHVGRHFRSHTGDRPYQCKECPQAFARSDLLSRHVNKAHRVPEEGGGKPSTSKKGRRKSMPTSSHPRKEPVVTEDVKPKKVVNRNRSSSLIDPPRVKVEPIDNHPALQAQSMYPHHPLLANPDLQTAPPWDGFTMTQQVPGPLTTAVPLSGANMPIMDQSMQGQFRFPMRVSESDQGIGSSSMGRVQSGSSASPTFEYVKKRACDQCSHSKVRCDFAEPCQRCTNRSIFCSYTKTPKARSMSMFPAQRPTYPASPFRSTTLTINNSSYSPLAFTPSPIGSGMLPPTARNSTSPTSVASALMPSGQMMPHAWSPSSVSPGTSAPSPLTHQMLQAPRPMPTVQPLPMDTSGIPAHMNSFSSVNLPISHLTATPSLTSMTTSPSGSDEPPERRGSLPGSMTYSNNWIEPSSSRKRPVQPAPQEPAQLQTPIQIPYTQMIRPDLANYTFGRTEGTIDPRIQFRNPTTLEDEDDVVAPLTAVPNSAISMNQDDLEEMQQRLNQRRRSSAHILGFNQMSLGDVNASGENAIPDPFTASMVAQEHQRKLQQLQQHIAATAGPAGPGNPALAPQSQIWTPEQLVTGTGKGQGEANQLWKAFMEPMADQNLSTNQHPQGSLVPLNAYHAKEARPEMPPRSLSKSSSMPDLQSPIAEPATLNLQPDQPARARAAQDDTDAMKQWRSEIRDRQSQSSFALSPTGSTGTRMKIDPTAFLEAAVAARTASRPLASVLQHSSALEQTLAPERTPSFGLDNLPTPTRAAFGFPGISSNNSLTGKSPRSSLGNSAVPPPSSPTPTGWSWKTTSVNARPGNKRLASQTLVGDAPKVGKTGGATFGFWDDDEVEADFGGLGQGVGGGELKVG